MSRGNRTRQDRRRWRPWPSLRRRNPSNTAGRCHPRPTTESFETWWSRKRESTELAARRARGRLQSTLLLSHPAKNVAPGPSAVGPFSARHSAYEIAPVSGTCFSKTRINTLSTASTGNCFQRPWSPAAMFAQLALTSSSFSGPTAPRVIRQCHRPNNVSARASASPASSNLRKSCNATSRPLHAHASPELYAANSQLPARLGRPDRRG